MLRPFLYALGVVVVLALGGFGYFAFAPLPVETKPVIKDVSVSDIVHEAPAPIPVAEPAAPVATPEVAAQPEAEAPSTAAPATTSPAPAATSVPETTSVPKTTQQAE